MSESDGPGHLTEAALIACVEAAIAAPSIHNSQPWRFRLGPDSVDVFADRTRHLDVIDPFGRELLISVGAAVFNLRLAMRQLARVPDVVLLPDPDQPDLVARITAGRYAPPTRSSAALTAAMSRRHTNRHPFARKAIPASAIDELKSAASHEGATISVAKAVARNAILALVHTADHCLRAQGDYRGELTRWTRATGGRRDGIPPQAFGPLDLLGTLPLRDFGLTQPTVRRWSEAFEPFPMIAVLSSDGDTPEHWVRSGQALQRVLLVATMANLAATPMSQPLEIPALRELITDTASGQWAQMILRLGYAPETTPTPRRSVTEVLDGSR